MMITVTIISISVKAQNSPSPSRSATTVAAQGESPAPAVVTTPAQLIQQGKSLYRAVRLKDALEKFEEALRLEQNPAARDEALGLAAITAFRLDNQPLSRQYFTQRSGLPDQKSSVRAFCHYRVALTYWREVHDKVASRGGIENGQFVQTILDSDRQEMEALITGGLKSVDETLKLVENYPEAYNIRNLLYAEAALLETDTEKATALRQLAVDALSRAADLSTQAAVAGRRNDVADFSQPTARLTEFSRTTEEEAQLKDPLMKFIEGGYPIKRLLPVFPPLKAPKAEVKSEPKAGETANLSPPPSNKVKIEVLVSVSGDVAFASQVDGRPEYGPSAILAARGWKFEPARLNGRPIQVSGLITFDVKSAKGR
jgi:tetratricopeptide (TPR) repeat protein